MRRLALLLALSAAACGGGGGDGVTAAVPTRWEVRELIAQNGCVKVGCGLLVTYKTFNATEQRYMAHGVSMLYTGPGAAGLDEPSVVDQSNDLGSGITSRFVTLHDLTVEVCPIGLTTGCQSKYVP